MNCLDMLVKTLINKHLYDEFFINKKCLLILTKHENICFYGYIDDLIL